MSRYKIIVRTLSGKLLTYTVQSYKAHPGGLMEFTDEVTGEVKRYPTSNCEINEVPQ